MSQLKICERETDRESFIRNNVHACAYVRACDELRVRKSSRGDVGVQTQFYDTLALFYYVAHNIYSDLQNKHSTHTQTVLGIKTSNIFRTTNEDYNARDLSSVPKFTKKKTKNPPNQLTTPWEGSLLEDFRPFGQIVRHRWIASMICQGFDKLC